MKQVTRGLIIACMMFGATGAFSEEFSVRGDISGNWYNPDQPGHGLQIEVMDGGGAIIAWYLYDQAGQPMWLFGQGDAAGDRIEAELFRYSGGGFPTDFDPEAVEGDLWGEAVISFNDCFGGEISWDPVMEDVPAGTIDLERLSGIGGLRCGQAEMFEQTVDFSLDAAASGWEALFADYGEAQIGSMDREAEWIALPEPLDDRRGYMLAGTNRPDDLAMFLSRPIGGLMPETTYQVELDMTFATNQPAGCVGIGGPPGEAVTVKLGASGQKPEVVENDGDYRLNIDKGNQSSEGEDALAVDDMTNGQGEELCDPDRRDERRWELKTVTTRDRTFAATTDTEGKLWIYGGSDSGFEGRTTFFITDFSVRLFALDEES